MKRTEDDRPSPMLIDQDSGIPASPERFSKKGTRDDLRPWQRDLPPSVSSELADRFRDLAARFPDAELRRWLADKEVDGLWSRLNEVIDALNDGRIGIIEESPTRAAETARSVPSARRTTGNAGSGTFTTSGSTQSAGSGTFSTGGSHEKPRQWHLLDRREHEKRGQWHLLDRRDHGSDSTGGNTGVRGRRANAVAKSGLAALRRRLPPEPVLRQPAVRRRPRDRRGLQHAPIR